MGYPVASSSLSNVSMGAASITWGGVYLGHTLGGAKFAFDRNFTELQVDKYGKTPVELALTGENLTIEVTCAEPIVDFMANAVPESADIGTIKKKIGLGVDAGTGLRQFAKQLILHPLDNAVTDVSEDVVVYLAVSVDKLELNYEVDKQRVFKVLFKALVDESRGNGYRLGQIGQDPIS